MKNNASGLFKFSLVLAAIMFAGLMNTTLAQSTWDTVTSGTTNILRGVVFADSEFVAVGASGTILTSSNGTAWTNRPSGLPTQLWGIAYGNNTFVAVGDSQRIITSIDGITWVSRKLPVAGSLYNVSFCNGTFAATGALSPTGAGLLYTSPDGITWTTQTAPANAMRGIGSANSQFFAWQKFNYTTTTDTARFFSSANAVSWSTLGKNSQYKVEGVAYGNNSYVTVGDSGTLYTSYNGTTWTQRTSGTTNTLWNVQFYNNLFIAVGANNTILTSSDGISWNSSTPTNTINDLSNLAYGNNTYVAVGTAGEIMVSSAAGFQAPVLYAPPNGALVASTAITTLSWSSVASALSYHIEGSTSSSFTSLSIDDSTLTTTSKAIIYLPGNTYYWRVSAKNNTGVSPWSAMRYFTVVSTVPGTPAIISPVSGSTGLATTLQLTWSTVTNGSSYRVQLSTVSDFSTLYIDTIGNPNTQLTLSNLSLNSIYFWRVSAINVVGQGSWSSVANFSTLGGILGAPTLRTPVSGALNLPKTVTFAWNSVASATSYRLQVTTNSTYATTLKDTISTATSKTLFLFSLNTKYYWRVAAIDGAGQGNWSGSYVFSTVGNIPSVTLVSPANNGIIPRDTVRLIWNKGNPSAALYSVQLAVDSAMTIFFVNTSTYTDTAMTVRSLVSGINYWWRVKAYNDSGWGAYSPVYTFKAVSTGTQYAHTIDRNILSLTVSAQAIHYTLPTAGMVLAQLFDLSGRLAATPISMFAQAGTHDAALPAALPSGRYLLLFKTGANTIARPVVIIK